jgi:hypothetical protein
VGKIVEAQRVEGLLEVRYEKEVHTEEKYKGKGRGSANRQKQTVEKVRYQITSVSRNEIKMALW